MRRKWRVAACCNIAQTTSYNNHEQHTPHISSPSTTALLHCRRSGEEEAASAIGQPPTRPPNNFSINNNSTKFCKCARRHNAKTVYLSAFYNLLLYFILISMLGVVSGTLAFSKNFVNISAPPDDSRPTFVVNFDMATVICQESENPEDLRIHEISVLCDGKMDCYNDPAMNDESFPYCEGRCNSTCSNRGACLYDGERAQCYCNAGTSGESCELAETNECVGKPCHWLAHCQNTFGAYQCQCFNGFKGDGYNQCSDIDECAEGTATCPANSKCVNLPGTYFCQCLHGFLPKGSPVEKCADIDECEALSIGSACPAERPRCQNMIGGYACVNRCSHGYEPSADDTRCIDVDECALSAAASRRLCDARAECVNTVGGYECRCEDGFTGDGHNCEPTVDCTQNINVCDRHAQCIAPLRMCICQVGYVGNGINCYDVNECNAEKNPCDGGGTNNQCVNIDGGYICCDPSVDESECIKEQGVFCAGGCGSNAICFNRTCQCQQGFHGDPNQRCTDINECDADVPPCTGVSQWCVNLPGGHTCCSPNSDAQECRLSSTLGGGGHFFANAKTTALQRSLVQQHSSTALQSLKVHQSASASAAASASASGGGAAADGSGHGSSHHSSNSIFGEESREQSMGSGDLGDATGGGSASASPNEAASVGASQGAGRRGIKRVHEVHEQKVLSGGYVLLTRRGNFTGGGRSAAQDFEIYTEAQRCEELLIPQQLLPAAARLPNCPRNSNCVHGFCKCQTGYGWNSATQICEDVNECQLLANLCGEKQPHTTMSTATWCVNTVGSYRCCEVLPNGTADCSGIQLVAENFHNPINLKNSIRRVFGESDTSGWEQEKNGRTILVDGETGTGGSGGVDQDGHQQGGGGKMQTVSFGEWHNFSGGQLIIRRGKSHIETEFRPLLWIQKYLGNSTYEKDSRPMPSEISNRTHADRFGLEIIWPPEENTNNNGIMAGSNKTAQNLLRPKLILEEERSVQKTKDEARLNFGTSNSRIEHIFGRLKLNGGGASKVNNLEWETASRNRKDESNRKEEAESNGLEINGDALRTTSLMKSPSTPASPGTQNGDIESTATVISPISSQPALTPDDVGLELSYHHRSGGEDDNKPKEADNNGILNRGLSIKTESTLQGGKTVVTSSETKVNESDLAFAERRGKTSKANGIFTTVKEKEEEDKSSGIGLEISLHAPPHYNSARGTLHGSTTSSTVSAESGESNPSDTSKHLYQGGVLETHTLKNGTVVVTLSRNASWVNTEQIIVTGNHTPESEESKEIGLEISYRPGPSTRGDNGSITTDSESLGDSRTTDEVDGHKTIISSEDRKRLEVGNDDRNLRSEHVWNRGKNKFRSGKDEAERDFTVGFTSKTSDVETSSSFELNITTHPERAPTTMLLPKPTHKDSDSDSSTTSLSGSHSSISPLFTTPISSESTRAVGTTRSYEEITVTAISESTTINSWLAVATSEKPESVIVGKISGSHPPSTLLPIFQTSTLSMVTVEAGRRPSEETTVNANGVHTVDGSELTTIISSTVPSNSITDAVEHTNYDVLQEATSTRIPNSESTLEEHMTIPTLLSTPKITTSGAEETDASLINESSTTESPITIMSTRQAEAEKLESSSTIVASNVTLGISVEPTKNNVLHETTDRVLPEEHNEATIPTLLSTLKITASNAEETDKTRMNESSTTESSITTLPPGLVEGSLETTKRSESLSTITVSNVTPVTTSSIESTKSTASHEMDSTKMTTSESMPNEEHTSRNNIKLTTDGEEADKTGINESSTAKSSIITTLSPGLVEGSSETTKRLESSSATTLSTAANVAPVTTSNIEFIKLQEPASTKSTNSKSTYTEEHNTITESPSKIDASNVTLTYKRLESSTSDISVGPSKEGILHNKAPKKSTDYENTLNEEHQGQTNIPPPQNKLTIDNEETSKTQINESTTEFTTTTLLTRQDEGSLHTTEKSDSLSPTASTLSIMSKGTSLTTPSLKEWTAKTIEEMDNNIARLTEMQSTVSSVTSTSNTSAGLIKNGVLEETKFSKGAESTPIERHATATISISKTYINPDAEETRINKLTSELPTVTSSLTRRLEEGETPQNIKKLKLSTTTQPTLSDVTSTSTRGRISHEESSTRDPKSIPAGEYSETAIFTSSGPPDTSKQPIIPDAEEEDQQQTSSSRFTTESPATIWGALTTHIKQGNLTSLASVSLSNEFSKATTQSIDGYANGTKHTLVADLSKAVKSSSTTRLTTIKPTTTVELPKLMSSVISEKEISPFTGIGKDDSTEKPFLTFGDVSSQSVSATATTSTSNNVNYSSGLVSSASTTSSKLSTDSALLSELKTTVEPISGTSREHIKTSTELFTPTLKSSTENVKLETVSYSVEEMLNATTAASTPLKPIEADQFSREASKAFSTGTKIEIQITAATTATVVSAEDYNELQQKLVVTASPHNIPDTLSENEVGLEIGGGDGRDGTLRSASSSAEQAAEGGGPKLGLEIGRTDIGRNSGPVETSAQTPKFDGEGPGVHDKAKAAPGKADSSLVVSSTPQTGLKISGRGMEIGRPLSEEENLKSKIGDEELPIHTVDESEFPVSVDEWERLKMKFKLESVSTTAPPSSSDKITSAQPDKLTPPSVEKLSGGTVLSSSSEPSLQSTTPGFGLEIIGDQLTNFKNQTDSNETTPSADLLNPTTKSPSNEVGATLTPTRRVDIHESWHLTVETDIESHKLVSELSTTVSASSPLYTKTGGITIDVDVNTADSESLEERLLRKQTTATASTSTLPPLEITEQGLEIIGRHLVTLKPKPNSTSETIITPSSAEGLNVSREESQQLEVITKETATSEKSNIEETAVTSPTGTSTSTLASGSTIGASIQPNVTIIITEIESETTVEKLLLTTGSFNASTLSSSTLIPSESSETTASSITLETEESTAFGELLTPTSKILTTVEDIISIGTAQTAESVRAITKTDNTTDTVTAKPGTAKKIQVSTTPVEPTKATEVLNTDAGKLSGENIAPLSTTVFETETSPKLPEETTSAETIIRNWSSTVAPEATVSSSIHVDTTLTTERGENTPIAQTTAVVAQTSEMGVSTSVETQPTVKKNEFRVSSAATADTLASTSAVAVTDYTASSPTTEAPQVTEFPAKETQPKDVQATTSTETLATKMISESSETEATQPQTLVNSKSTPAEVRLTTAAATGVPSTPIINVSSRSTAGSPTTLTTTTEGRETEATTVKGSTEIMSEASTIEGEKTTYISTAPPSGILESATSHGSSTGEVFPKTVVPEIKISTAASSFVEASSTEQSHAALTTSMLPIKEASEPATASTMSFASSETTLIQNLVTEEPSTGVPDIVVDSVEVTNNFNPDERFSKKSTLPPPSSPVQQETSTLEGPISSLWTTLLHSVSAENGWPHTPSSASKATTKDLFTLVSRPETSLLSSLSTAAAATTQPSLSVSKTTNSGDLVQPSSESPAESSTTQSSTIVSSESSGQITTEFPVSPEQPESESPIVSVTQSSRTSPQHKDITPGSGSTTLEVITTINGNNFSTTIKSESPPSRESLEKSTVPSESLPSSMKPVKEVLNKAEITLPKVEESSSTPLDVIAETQLPSTEADLLTFTTPTELSSTLSNIGGSGVRCVSSDECGLDAYCERRSGACRCQPGFRGAPPLIACVDIDECAEMTDDCHPTAQCHNVIGSYSCNCVSGYRKSPIGACEDINECAEQNGTLCGEHAKCTNLPGFYTCQCNIGFIGDGYKCIPIEKRQCTQEEWVASDCGRNHLCLVDAHGYIDCDTCRDGYRKSHGVCSDIDECVDPNSNRCHSDAVCVNLMGSYRCECQPGFAGDGFYCADVDECAATGRMTSLTRSAGDDLADRRLPPVLAMRCHPQAQCINVPGTYQCHCPVGWIGDGARGCDAPALEKTKGFDSYAAQSNSNRIDLSPTCATHKATVCGGRKRLDASICLVIKSTDYRQLKTDVAANAFAALDADGSTRLLICECADGFRYDVAAGECEDVDECVERRHNCDRTAGAECRNVDGGFVCECVAGFEGVNGMCKDIDECEVGTANCHANARCVNTIGGFLCRCADGFTGNGVECQSSGDADRRPDNTCPPEWIGMCKLVNKTCHIDDEEVPQCDSCLFGYQPMDGKCQQINEVGNCADPSKNNCNENAECIDIHPGKHFCTCRIGFIGDGMRCDDVDECSIPGLCDSNAICTNKMGSFDCRCKPGYQGDGIRCKELPKPVNTTSSATTILSTTVATTRATISSLPPSTSTDAAKNMSMVGRVRAEESTGIAETETIATSVPLPRTKTFTAMDCHQHPTLCHIHATCDADGVCRCRGAYIGDGIYYCGNAHSSGVKSAHEQPPSPSTVLSFGATSRTLAPSVYSGRFTGFKEIYGKTTDGSNFTTMALSSTTVKVPELRTVAPTTENISLRVVETTASTTLHSSTSSSISTSTATNHSSEHLATGSQPEVMTTEALISTTAYYYSHCGGGHAPNNVECHALATCDYAQGSGNGDGICVCNSGFDGDGITSCTPAWTDCTQNTSTCHQFAECDARSGQCVCLDGYVGDGIAQCTPDRFDCAARGRALCSLFADCIGRRCVCRTGYTGDGITCMQLYMPPESVNDCLSCHCKAACVAGACKCQVGYYGNGLLCVPDPEDCVNYMALCGTATSAFCNAATRRCECADGYVGDGRKCVMEGRPLTCQQRPEMCAAEADCLPSGNCQCRSGWFGNGRNCTKWIEQLIGTTDSSSGYYGGGTSSPGAHVCGAHADYVNGACRCRAGYVENQNGICQDIDECRVGAALCDANAACHNGEGTYGCECFSGYVGDGKTCHPQPIQRVGDVGVQCLSDGIRLHLAANAYARYGARVFVRGQSDNPYCARNFSPRSTTVTSNATDDQYFHIPITQCDMQLEENNTVVVTVIVQQHPTFVTQSAHAYRLRCTYPTPTITLAGHFNVSELAPQALAVAGRGPEPICMLTVTNANDDKAVVVAATVGDPLRLRLSVEPRETYAILPRNCYAINMASGERYALTDAAGCAVDTALFPEWSRLKPYMTQALFHTFKWPDTSMIRFECDCSACFGMCPTINCDRRRDVTAAIRRRVFRLRVARANGAENNVSMVDHDAARQLEEETRWLEKFTRDATTVSDNDMSTAAVASHVISIVEGSETQRQPVDLRDVSNLRRFDGVRSLVIDGESTLMVSEELAEQKPQMMTSERVCIGEIWLLSALLSLVVSTAVLVYLYLRISSSARRGEKKGKCDDLSATYYPSSATYTATTNLSSSLSVKQHVKRALNWCWRAVFRVKRIEPTTTTTRFRESSPRCQSSRDRDTSRASYIVFS